MPCFRETGSFSPSSMSRRHQRRDRSRGRSRGHSRSPSRPLCPGCGRRGHLLTSCPLTTPLSPVSRRRTSWQRLPRSLLVAPVFLSVTNRLQPRPLFLLPLQPIRCHPACPFRLPHLTWPPLPRSCNCSPNPCSRLHRPQKPKSDADLPSRQPAITLTLADLKNFHPDRLHSGKNYRSIEWAIDETALPDDSPQAMKSRFKVYLAALAELTKAPK